MSQRSVGRKSMNLKRRAMSHSLLRSLVLSHRSLIHLLRSARFAHALRFARIVRSLALTRSRAKGKEIYTNKLNAPISYSFNPYCSGASKRTSKWLSILRVDFISILPIVRCWEKDRKNNESKLIGFLTDSCWSIIPLKVIDVFNHLTKYLLCCFLYHLWRENYVVSRQFFSF